MANIRDYLAQILSARYGKDVRNAIHDSIEEINNVNEANIATVQAIADDAEASATSASTSAGTATTKASQASASATLAESWTVGGTGTRTGEDTNNAHYWEQQAKYWHDQAEQIAESLSGALRPMGTITFANLPSVSSATAGDMYNISDAFTTTSDFVEGAGIQVPLGSNVYMTTHQKWDVLAGSPVTGVKGNSESTYRRGNVNITKTDIGLGNVDNESLGTTDISSIGDGTVKGAISELNSDLDGQHVMYEQRRHSFGFSSPASLADALQQTAQHILAYIQGLDDGVSVEILNMKFIGAGNIIMKNDSDILLDNTATDFSIHAFCINTSGTTMYLYDMIAWANTASANRISRAVITNGANPTFSNLSLSDLSTLTGFNFDIRVWKKL